MGNPTVTPLVEQRHDFGFIVSDNGLRSYDQMTLTGGAKAFAGTLLGKITANLVATALALGTNTGTGTFGTITPQAAPATIVGTYTLLMTAPTTFIVTAPDGATATGSTGTAFSALGVGFTLAAGGTAFLAGDTFTFTVVGTQGNPTITSAAGASNAGNGTLSGVVAAGYAAVVGTYTVEFDDATHFVLFAPNGQEAGHGTTGVAFKSGGLAFTITAGGTAFVPGDSFAITVGVGNGFVKAWDPANVDGSQVVCGILCATKDATNANKQAAVLVRAAEANQSELIFPPGANAAVIAMGVAGLTALGLICR